MMGVGHCSPCFPATHSCNFNSQNLSNLRLGPAMSSSLRSQEIGVPWIRFHLMFLPFQLVSVTNEGIFSLVKQIYQEQLKDSYVAKLYIWSGIGRNLAGPYQP